MNGRGAILGAAALRLVITLFANDLYLPVGFISCFEGYWSHPDPSVIVRLFLNDFALLCRLLPHDIIIGVRGKDAEGRHCGFGSSKSFLLSMGPAIRACRQLQATAAGEVEGGAVSRLASLFREAA